MAVSNHSIFPQLAHGWDGHLFHPFCDEISTKAKVAAIAFHVFTLCIPLILYTCYEIDVYKDPLFTKSIKEGEEPSIDYATFKSNILSEKESEVGDIACLEDPVKQAIKDGALLVQVGQGGESVVFTVDGFSEKIVLKGGRHTAWSKKECEAYVARTNRAREICRQNGYDYIKIPQSMVLHIGCHYYILEERCALVGTGEQEGRGCSYRALSDPDLESAMKTRMEQLAGFICKMKLSDVKPNNVQFTQEGDIACFDLDEASAVRGLTWGLADRQYGFFKMLPSKWFTLFQNEVERYLTPDEFSKVVSDLPAVQRKVDKREKMHVKAHRWYQRKGVTSSKQLLTATDNLSPEACKAVVYINSQLQKTSNLDLIKGRRVTTSQKVISAATAEELKQKRIIFSARISEDNQTIILHC